MKIKNKIINDDFGRLFRCGGISRPQLRHSFLEGNVVSKQKQFLTLYTGWKKTTKLTEKEFLSRKPIMTTVSSPIGQRVQFYIHDIENTDHDIVFNTQYYAHKMKAITAWDRVCHLKYVKGILLNTVNGGFSVGIGGVVSFLPRSRAKLPSLGKKDYVNYLMNHYCLYKIIKINAVRRNIVVSLVHTPEITS